MEQIDPTRLQSLGHRMTFADAALDDAKAAAPVIWVMLSHRVGDSIQVMALANALGWPFEVKSQLPEGGSSTAAPMKADAETGLAADDQEQVWPDLILSAGWRSEVRARQVRARAARHGHRVRLVHVGRPWIDWNVFDLVVSPPQYRPPEGEHILRNKTPLHEVTKERLVEAEHEWRPHLAAVPGPYVSLLIGGHSGQFNFSRNAACRLALQASRFAEARGATLLITTSARTPDYVVDAIEEHVQVPNFLFKWEPGAEKNPYYAFLAMGDQIIVTCDSVSMMTEACATRKPVYMFRLDSADAETPAAALPELEQRRGFEWGAWLGRLRAGLYSRFLRTGPRRMTRDITLVHQHLVESKRAVWLGEEFEDWQETPPLDSMSRAVARVRGFFDGREEKRQSVFAGVEFVPAASSHHREAV